MKAVVRTLWNLKITMSEYSTWFTLRLTPKPPHLLHDPSRPPFVTTSVVKILILTTASGGCLILKVVF